MMSNNSLQPTAKRWQGSFSVERIDWHQGVAHPYIPDFIVKIEMPDKSILNLVLEVTGKKDDKKTMKVKTARKFWVPSVNNMERFGKWAFLEIQDVHETQNLILAGITSGFDTIK